MPNVAAMKTAGEVLSPREASRLADYKRAVERALPAVGKFILFGSRARGQGHEDSDYDVAVFLRDPYDLRQARRILSDLAYDHILSGFFIRPIPLPPDYLAPPGRRLTELAEDILRDGAEVS